MFLCDTSHLLVHATTFKSCLAVPPMWSVSLVNFSVSLVAFYSLFGIPMFIFYRPIESMDSDRGSRDSTASSYMHNDRLSYLVCSDNPIPKGFPRPMVFCIRLFLCRR